jgi:fructose/tagatose bisphosphate aldolase
MGCDDNYVQTGQEEFMAEQERVKEFVKRYHAAAHAMQSGVAMKINYDPSDTSPKHLRVGVNSAMVDNSALAWLLIRKGIISEEEYFEALASQMEQEKEMYEHEINEHFGRTDGSITLK